jgi:hypothetical protein
MISLTPIFSVFISRLPYSFQEQQQLYSALQEEHEGMVREFHRLEHDHSRCKRRQTFFFVTDARQKIS